MRTISRAVVIQAPRSAVWAALADFGGVSRMSGGVLRSHLTSDQATGCGTTRHCDLAMMGATVEERITAWSEGERMVIDIYDWTKMPLVTSMSASFGLADDGTGTKLVANMVYELGLGPIGWLADAMMMRAMMTRNWSQFVAGVRHHVETGELVEQKTRLDLSGIR